MPAEDPGHAVVALVAGVLVERLVAPPHRDRRRPRARPGLGIGHGVGVVQRVRVHPGQALDQGHVAGRAPPAALVVEVRGLDHQCVALPVAARVPRPLADVTGKHRAAVERHDPYRVNHLGHQHHLVGSLEDLQVLVVAAGRDRRAGVEAENAAVEGAAVEPGVGRMIPQVGAPGVGALPALGRHLRQTAVRRVDDERRAPGADGARAAVEPEVVVEAGRTLLAPVHALGGRGAPGGPVGELDVAVDDLLLQVGRLFRGQERPVAQLLGPLQRRDGAEVPDALQIRIPPAGPQLVLGRGRRRRQQHGRGQHGRDAYGRENSVAHRNPLPWCRATQYTPSSQRQRRGHADDSRTACGSTEFGLHCC